MGGRQHMLPNPECLLKKLTSQNYALYIYKFILRHNV